MLQSWRWFGPSDPITLREIQQTGATDIVTALHHVRCGELWSSAEIAARVELVAQAGLRWSVVESLPVHEDIKTRSGNYRHYLDVYIQSLHHLAAHGLKIICYNFMPVLDWTRTDVNYPLADGSLVLSCDFTALAAFDLFILRRPGAEADYSAAEIDAARAYYEQLDETGRQRLAGDILLGLPGTVDDLSIEAFRRELARYEATNAAKLRENLYAFLNAIMPTCDQLGIRMAIHPDDPPRPIFGLPRIVSTAADVQQLLTAVPSPNNGLTFCTGSFGGRRDNDPAAMFQRFAARVHFAHLRNVAFDEMNEKSFRESTHLHGQVDMVGVMRALIAEEERRRAQGWQMWQIQVRPDHGKLLDCDRNRGSYSGYSYAGRLMGLAELRGLELGLRHEIVKNFNVKE